MAKSHAGGEGPTAVRNEQRLGERLFVRHAKSWGKRPSSDMDAYMRSERSNSPTQQTMRGETSDNSGSLEARGRVCRIIVRLGGTGEKVAMAKVWHALARCILHPPPEIAFFRGLSPQYGMVGRTNPSPAWEPPECCAGMNQQEEGTGKTQGRS